MKHMITLLGIALCATPALFSAEYTPQADAPNNEVTFYTAKPTASILSDSDASGRGTTTPSGMFGCTTPVQLAKREQSYVLVTPQCPINVERENLDKADGISSAKSLASQRRDIIHAGLVAGLAQEREREAQEREREAQGREREAQSIVARMRFERHNHSNINNDIQYPPQP